MSKQPDLATLSGLDVLTLFIEDPERWAPPFSRTLGFSLREVERGRAVFEGTPEQRFYNPRGIIHGGYAAFLLDSACGCAVHSCLEAGQGHTTVELKVAYHKAMTQDTGPVRAEGKIITLGRRMAFTEARVTDASGRLYASATSSLMIL
jgi:uncharacterized protein (TIGR00369 family)